MVDRHTGWLTTWEEREEDCDESKQSHHAHVEGQGVNLGFRGGEAGYQSGQETVIGWKNQDEQFC